MIFRDENLTISSLEETLPVIGYESIVTIANVATTTEDEDHPAVNLANEATHLKWKGGVNTAGLEFVTVTFASRSIDYLAIARHNFGTQGYDVDVEVNTNDSPDWVAISFTGGVAIADDDPIIFQIEPQTVTGIRLRITTTGQDDEPPELAVLYVGSLLTLERGIKVDVDHVPLPLARRTSVVSGMSESGNFMGRNVLNQYLETVAEFSWFDPTWYRANFDPFVEQAKETPFFFAWAPEDYPDDVGYCWLIADPMPATHPATLRVAVNLEMRGLA